MQLEASLDYSQPQVGSSRDDKQDETFWNEPPSGLGYQQNSGALPCIQLSKNLDVPAGFYSKR